MGGSTDNSHADSRDTTQNSDRSASANQSGVSDRGRENLEAGSDVNSRNNADARGEDAYASVTVEGNVTEIEYSNEPSAIDSTHSSNSSNLENSSNPDEHGVNQASDSFQNTEFDSNSTPADTVQIENSDYGTQSQNELTLDDTKADPDIAENQSNVNELNDTVKAVSEGMQNVVTHYENQVDSSTNFGEVMKASGELLQEASEVLGDAAQGLGENIEGNFGQAGDGMEAVGGVVGEVIEGVAEMTLETGEMAGSVAGNVVENFGDAMNHSIEAVDYLSRGEITDAAQEVAKAAIDTARMASGTIREVAEGAGEVAGEGVEAVGEVSRELFDGVRDLFD